LGWFVVTSPEFKKWAAPPGSVVNEFVEKVSEGAVEASLEGNVQKWIKASFADPEAELKGLGPEFEWDGAQLRVAMIRGHNAFGGWIFIYRLLTVSKSGEFRDLGDVEKYAQEMARRHKDDKDSGIDKVFDFTHRSGMSVEMAKGIKFGPEIRD
jgi:hypothetical protein